MSKDVRARLAGTLIALEKDPVIAKPPLKATGFVAATDADYNDLRAVFRDLAK